LDGLEALILLAGMQEDFVAAREYIERSIAISEQHYPLPNHLANLYLQLGKTHFLAGDSETSQSSLERALEIYSDTDNANGMVAGLCLLNQIRMKRNQLDAVAQSFMVAEPFLQRSNHVHQKACFIAFSVPSLNLRGKFDLADRYIEQLRELSKQTNNDFYLVLAESLVVHQLYVQSQFVRALRHVDSIRAILDQDGVLPSARRTFAVIDTLISSRSQSPDEASRKVERYLQEFSRLREENVDVLDFTRAQGHILVAQERIDEGIHLLLEVEAAFRAAGYAHLANYVGYEVLEVLLRHPEREYQETLRRIEGQADYDYLFFKLKAAFMAREGKYLDAAIVMSENRERAGDLWKPGDQLLLEYYQRKSR
jgi:tetratricopeptide (TPR) repeat protein